MSPTQQAPAEPLPTADPADERPDGGTAVLPVVDAPATAEEVHPMASLPPVGAATATGPIDVLPDLPPPPPGAAQEERRGPRLRRGLPRLRRPAGASRLSPGRSGRAHVPAGLAAPALAVVAVVLLELGLVAHEDGGTLWSRTPLWAAFATVAAVLGLVAFVPALPGPPRPDAGRTWAVAAGGLCGLAVFWLLVVLPTAATDRGFLVTAALACLGAALWTAPGRTGAQPEAAAEDGGTEIGGEQGTAEVG